MRGWAVAVAILLAPAAARSEGLPAMDPSSEAPAAKGRSVDGTVGWGYYQLLHVGAALHLDPRSTVGALVGSNLGVNGATDWSVGIDYAHALGQPLWDVQLGWKAQALYWTQSDPDYDWRLLSLLLGVTAVRPVTPELSLALDVSGVFTTALASDRKQNVTFSHPQKWNGSVCLELWIHFASW